MTKQELQQYLGELLLTIRHSGARPDVRFSGTVTALAMLAVSDSIDGLASAIEKTNTEEALTTIANCLSGIKDEVRDVAARVSEIEGHG